MRRVFACALVALVVLALPGLASAQSASTGAIAGVVKDTTGAVLPGVTVEAASPALIEKVRTVTTDAQGNYKIADLRPGTYTVTFTLTGFGTFKQEGLQLTSGFTATVNADLKVGSLEESVTVTGAAPVVDVQNVRQQTVLSRDVLDTLPTGKAFQAFTALTLGAQQTFGQQDVGGNQGELYAPFIVHNDHGNSRLMQDGMQIHGLEAAASGKHYHVNSAFVQEVSIGVSGMSAESEVGGTQINVVPRDGGNRVSGYFSGNGTGPKLQADNLDDALRARGLKEASKVKKIYDLGGSLGGPVQKDRLWFFTAHRWWGADNYAPGNYFNASQGKYLGAANSGVAPYTPDLSRPAYTNNYQRDNSVRLTWQASAKDKVTASLSLQENCNCYFNVDGQISQGQVTPEASSNVKYTPQRMFQSTWNRPVTSRLLLEAGFTYYYDLQRVQRTDGVTTTDIALTELSTQLRYNANAFSDGFTGIDYGDPYLTKLSNQRFAVSYVTGSHAFKVGMTALEASNTKTKDYNQAISYSFFFGQPISLTQYVSPFDVHTVIKPNLGIYAQDQWKLSKLTLNLGVRFDYLNASAPAWKSPSGRFSAAQDFPALGNLPNWKDISPRIGAAYDLFGDGRTGLKFSLGRYVANTTNQTVAIPAAPVNQVTPSTSRSWFDLNGNYVPDCNLTSVSANGECGAMANPAFGTPQAVNTFDPDFLKGFGARQYQWQTSASLQHELRPGLGINVAYYYNWWGNPTVTVNRAVTPADFTQYCVTAPSDARLGPVSGKQVCGLYDRTPAGFAKGTSNYTTFASEFGNLTETYAGIDFGVNARFGKGGLLFGGVNTGKTVTDNCEVVANNPQVNFTGSRAPEYCKVEQPWKAQTQIKFSGSYPLPGGLTVSGTFQNLAGAPRPGFYVVTDAQTFASLGRPLTAPGGFAFMPIIYPNSVLERRLNQLDVRLLKLLTLGGARVQATFDIYNILNANNITSQTAVYGTDWLRPRAILGARMFKFGAQLNF